VKLTDRFVTFYLVGRWGEIPLVCFDNMLTPHTWIFIITPHHREGSLCNTGHCLSVSLSHAWP